MKIPATIGAIQIEPDVVRVAVVRTGGRAPRVIELVETPVPSASHGSQEAALRESHAQLRSKPAVWVLLVPASWSVVRLLAVPFRSARKVSAAVPFELEPTLAVPIDDLVLVHLPARVESGQTHVVAIGVRRDQLAAQVSLAARAGITIEGAYLDAIALTSLWWERHAARRQGGARAVLHFRPGEVLLAVVEDGRLAYLRRLESDPVEFRTAPSGVAREVRNLLRAYAAERGADPPVDAVSITGAQLHEAGRMVFEGDLELPVRYEELATGLPGFTPLVSSNEAISDEFNRWSAPISAAAAAAGGPFHRNLLTSGVTSSARMPRTIVRAAMRVCVMGAVVLVAYFILVALDYRRAQKALDQYGEAVFEEFARAYPDIAIERPPNDLGGRESFRLLQEAAQAENANSMGVSLDAFSAPTLLEVLLEVSSAITPAIAEIEEINIRPLRGYHEVLVRGRIIDSLRFNEAIDRLDASEALNVNRDQSTRVTEGGRESFTLRARM